MIVSFLPSVDYYPNSLYADYIVSNKRLIVETYNYDEQVDNFTGVIISNFCRGTKALFTTNNIKDVKIHPELELFI